MPEYPFQSKRQIAESNIPYHVEGYTVPSSPLWVLEATQSTLRNTAPIYTGGTEGCQLWVEPNARKSYTGCTADLSVTWALQSSRPYHGGGISGGKKDACGAYKEPQWDNHNAGTWDSGTRPSHLQWRILCNICVCVCVRACACVHARAQFLMCYWALLQTECLTLGKVSDYTSVH